METPWQKKLDMLRQAYNSRDFAAVARNVVAMGSSKQAGELNDVLALEVIQGDSAGTFTSLLHAFRENDVDPHHAVDLYHTLEDWFRQRVPSISMWNVVIHALVLGGCGEEALDLVRSMESGEDARLPMPTIKTYTMLVPSVRRAGGLTAAASLEARMTLRALEPDSIYAMLMMVVCTNSNPRDIEGAKFWMRRAEERMKLEVGPYNMQRRERRAVMLYNTLMAGYSKIGRLKDCFALLGCMRSRAIRPDAVTFAILMNACMRYSAYGTEECRQLLRIMQQMGVEPNTANYNMLVRGYGNSGQLTSALRVANRMREAGIPWDQYTYTWLISAVIAAGQVELSLRLLAKMRSDGVRPRAVHYTLTFVGLARAGFYEDAGRVFRRLATIKGLAGQFQYNMMIGVNCQRGDMEAAVEVRDMMEANGFEADSMTYRLLLEGYTMQQKWEQVLQLQGPLLQLRSRLQRIVRDPSATSVARAEASAALEGFNSVRNWTKAYYLLIDAAVWQGEWSRAVSLVEELVEQGLPVDFRKHARLLQEAKTSVRFGLGLANAARNSPPQVFHSTTSPEAREAQERWLRLSPNLQEPLASVWAKGGSSSGLLQRVRVGATPGEAAALNEEPKILVPPHMFCASFDPELLEGAGPGDASKRSMAEILDLCLAGGSASSQEAYRVVHDYHHATVRRRSVATLQLPPGRSVICRPQPETVESLSRLFGKFGKPGAPGAPIFLFTRPAAATLDALLAMLAVGAARPKDVLLLRGPSEPKAVEAIAEECRARADRPLGYSLTSTLAAMPAALLVNSQLLVTAGSDLLEDSPEDFQSALMAALEGGGGSWMPDGERGSEDQEEADEELANGDASGTREAAKSGATPAEWAAWLKGQRLNQMVRVGPGQSGVRLDGQLHQPALSRAELFRLRGLRDSQVAVDLWLEEEGVVSEFT